MKKLLGLAAVAGAAALTLTACGGTTSNATVAGVKVTDYADGINKMIAGDVDFAGAWADVRTTVDGSSNSIEAVGVEKNRIANDGIQARENISSHDIAVIQSLFIKMINDTNNANLKLASGKSLFSVYSHSAYVPTTSTTKKVTYLNAGVPTQKTMSSTAPADSIDSVDGALFKRVANKNDYASYETADGVTLKIEFIPSNDPTLVTEASTKLKTFLNSIDVKAEVTTATDYNTAARKLNEKTIDLAFLPVNTWATEAAQSKFILQAGRPTQVATLGWDGTKVELTETMTNQRHATKVMNELSQLFLQDVTTSKLATAAAGSNAEKFKTIKDSASHDLKDWATKVTAFADANEGKNEVMIAGSYESFIYAKKGSEFSKLINAAYANTNYNEDWTAELGANEFKYAYTSTTSGASYVFPELWINRHLNATIAI